jgi:NAD(P)-dependent dehydrogenase (short-subunit alcohol dehydrogenase family)
VSVHRVDVGSPEQIQEFATAATAAHPKLNILINNAGVALLGAFDEVDQAQMEWLININFWGVVHGTRAFLPHLGRQREAHVVNLSSIFGIVAPPGQTAYCAAKFAVRGFSESLRHELAMANSPVKLSVVHPGGVLTNIVRNSRTGTGVTDNARRAESIDRFDAIARTTPPIAARRIVTGIEKNQPRILIGNDARLMDLLQRFRPATYWAVLAKRIGKAAEKKGK